MPSTQFLSELSCARRSTRIHSRLALFFNPRLFTVLYGVVRKIDVNADFFPSLSLYLSLFIDLSLSLSQSTLTGLYRRWDSDESPVEFMRLLKSPPFRVMSSFALSRDLGGTGRMQFWPRVSFICLKLSEALEDL